MNTVLIVEDEILARLGLHQLLEWEKLGFVLLEDALDGEEAMKSICTHEPDIILLDLNIPKVDGLKILEFIREKRIESKVIVISCNEEFDVVKEAMKLGAFDYLRKLNLSANELLGLLQKCCSNKDRRAYEKKQEYVFREIRYEELIRTDGRDIFANTDTYQSAICISGRTDKELFETSAALKSQMTEHMMQYVQITKGSQCVFFLTEKFWDNSEYVELGQILKSQSGKEIYAGIYQCPMQNHQQVREALLMAEQVVILLYYDEEAKIYHITKKIEVGGHSPKEILGLLSVLKTSVSDFMLIESKMYICRIIDEIRKNKYTHVNVLRRIFMDILGIYSMTAQGLNGNIEEIEVQNDNCHYQKVMMMNSLNTIEAWFLEFAEIFYRRFFIRYKCSGSDILQKTVDYVSKNICQQITLSETAKEIGVTGAYLSTVFKKEIGQNFIEYVNIQKIEAAKIMLDKGKFVYEVSGILGFENVTYFSKVFKKYAGISADKWRKREV